MTVQNQYLVDFQNHIRIPSLTMVTPEMAKDFLTKNTNNYRAISKSVVDKISKAITNGEWKINGTTIKFTKDGRLMDGQHRLLAIIKSGISVPSIVVYELPEDSDITLGEEEKRKLSDHLTKKGESNTKLLSSVLNIIVTYSRGTFYNKNEKITATSAIKILDNYPTIRDSVSKFSKKNLIATPSVLAVCHFLLKLKHKNNSELVEDFFDRLIGGNNLSENNPILVLRNTLISIKTKGNSGLSRKFTASMLMKTWNYHVSTKKKRKLTKNFLLKDSIIPKFL